MTPEFPKSQREELELRITALLMGELSAEEAASVREAIARDPELAALEQQLKVTIRLVKETAAESAEGLVTAAQAPRLSHARREKLLATFKGTPSVSHKRGMVVDWRTWGALAAMVTGLLAVAALMFKQPSRSSDSGAGFLDFDADTPRLYSYSAKPNATQSPPGGAASTESESLVRRDPTVVQRGPYDAAGDSPAAPVDTKANQTSGLGTVVQEPNGRFLYLPSQPEDSAKLGVEHSDESGGLSTRSGLASSGKKEAQNTFQERLGQRVNRAAAGEGVATESYGMQSLQQGGYVQLQNGQSQGQNAGKLDQQARMDPSTELASKPASASGGSESMDLRRKEAELSSVVAPGQNIAQAGARTSGPAPAPTPPVVNESLAYDATPALTPSPANTPSPAVNPSAGVPMVNAPLPAARPERRNLAQTEKQVAQNVDSVQTVPTSDFGNVTDGTVATFSVNGLGAISTNSYADNYSSFGRTLSDGQVLNWDMQTANGLGGHSGRIGGGGFGGAANQWKDQSTSLSQAKNAEDGRSSGGRFGSIVLPQVTDREKAQMLPSESKNVAALAAEEKLKENVSQEAKQSQSGRSLERTSEVRQEVALGDMPPRELQSKPVEDLLRVQIPDESAAPALGKDRQLRELELRLGDKINSTVPETEEAKRLAGDAGKAKETQTVLIQKKLDGIRLEKLSADGLPLVEVVNQLSEEIRKQDPDRKGINLIIAPPNPDSSLPIEPSTGLPMGQMTGIDVGSAIVKLNLTNVTVREALEKISQAADLPVKVSVGEHGVILASPNSEKQIDAQAQKHASSPLVPQPEITSSANPFSTFSLNVSDVSFKLAAASLEKGVMPEAASVRSEEFINAFDYHDPEPGGSAPIAFNWERARYPFAHGRDLLRFSIKTAASGRAAGQPLNLVLLLDNSGSMERADRVRIRTECLRVLGSQLQPQDRVSVVAFARTPRLWVDGLPGNQAGDLPQRVGTLAPEGGTNLEEAMNLAYQTALRHYLPDGANRVVLLTDGAANLGEVKPESLKQKVEAHRKQGVALDCFGIGWEGYNDDLLEVLSRNGDGRYGFVNSPEAAKTEFANQLAGALQVAASDVKVQVEFNPKRTTAYRQIGYAKHQLTKEQFRDNTVDAAEIGAAEAGNALYVVQVNPQGEGPIATLRARFKVPGTTDYREHEWVVPFTGEAKELERSNAPMRLAAVASAFSEWLAASPYAGEVTTDQLLRLLNGVPETFGSDPRPKKLEWMVRQAKSVSGK